MTPLCCLGFVVRAGGAPSVVTRRFVGARVVLALSGPADPAAESVSFFFNTFGVGMQLCEVIRA